MDAISSKVFSFLHSPISFDVIHFFSGIECKIYLISKLTHLIDVAESIQASAMWTAVADHRCCAGVKWQFTKVYT